MTKCTREDIGIMCSLPYDDPFDSEFNDALFGNIKQVKVQYKLPVAVLGMKTNKNHQTNKHLKTHSANSYCSSTFLLINFNIFHS